MKTIEDMKQAKKVLERNILMEIQEFEDTYGVIVVGVHTDFVQSMGSPPKTKIVRVEVRI